jgi:putative thioredoxin
LLTLKEMNGAVIEVDEGDFESRVVEASRRTPVVVDFWAGWCQPCLILSPVLERLAEEDAGRFVLAKVDVDRNPNLAMRFGVQGIPAVKAFRDGEVAWEFVGVQPEDVIRRYLGELLPSEADGLVAEAGGASEPDAEEALRRALELEPGHRDASVSLARLLTRRGEVDEARKLLAALPPDGEVRALSAELELKEAARDGSEVGRLAALAAEGRTREALEGCLRLIREDGDRDGPARELMLRLFEVLGDGDPLTREFRPRLASALF